MTKDDDDTAKRAEHTIPKRRTTKRGFEIPSENNSILTFPQEKAMATAKHSESKLCLHGVPYDIECTKCLIDDSLLL